MNRRTAVEAADASRSGTDTAVPDRILAIIANEAVSGPGRQLGALATALADRDVRLTVAILHRRGNPHPPYADYLNGLGVEHVLVEDNGRLDFGLVGRLRELVRDRRPSIIQTHGYKATGAVWALRRSGVRLPWVGFFHGETHEDLKARFYHWLDHRMLASADRVVVMSVPQLRSFARLGPRARIIHNAVLPDPGLAGPDDAAEVRRTAEGRPRPVLGVVGRLSPEKGVDIFMDACAILLEGGHPFHALIAGDGPDMQRLRDRVVRLGIQDHVSMLGNVRNVRALYECIDVLVIPSRSEGLPNVLLEALGADRPVVATSVGAVPEVLTESLSGIVVDPGDAGAIADAIPAAYAQLDRSDAIASRAATARRFSVDARTEHHLSLYREVLA